MNAINWKKIEDGQARFAREVASVKGQKAYQAGMAAAEEALRLGRDPQFHAMGVRTILGEPVASDFSGASAYETTFWDGYWAVIDHATQA